MLYKEIYYNDKLNKENIIYHKELDYRSIKRYVF